MKEEVHKHHELSEKLRRDKEVCQMEFQKQKDKVETQIRVSSLHPCSRVDSYRFRCYYVSIPRNSKIRLVDFQKTLEINLHL